MVEQKKKKNEWEKKWMERSRSVEVGRNDKVFPAK